MSLIEAEHIGLISSKNFPRLGMFQNLFVWKLFFEIITY